MKETSAGAFDTDVFQSQGLVLVDFYTEECGACRRLTPVIEEVERAAKGHLQAVSVNATREATLTGLYRVQTVPTLLLFRCKRLLGQRWGAKSVTELQRWIAETAGW